MRIEQNQVDESYDDLHSILINEVNKHIAVKDVSRKLKWSFRTNKAFWTNELTHLWKDAVRKENIYLKSKGVRNN